MDKEIVVYSKYDCSNCEQVKRWLKWAKVPYTEINVQEDEQALNHVKDELGYQALPVIEVTEGEETYNFQGFNIGKLAKLKRA